MESTAPTENAAPGMSRDIPVDQIRPNPDQPRRHFAGIEELATSLREQGQVTPILVRPVDGGGYEIVHGERRWRAAKEAGLATLRAEVRPLTDEAAYRLALVENVQRANLNAVEEAEAYRRLLGDPGEPGMTQEQVGALVGKTQSYVAQKLRLLTAPAPLRVLVAEGALSEGHVRQLLKVERLQAPWAKRPFLVDRVRALLKADGPAPAVERLGAMYNVLRPEEQPPLPLYAFPKERVATSPHLPALQRSYVTLLEGVVSAGGVIPQWQVTAWWWGHGAVVFRLAVSTLATQVDRWAQRHRSAYLHLRFQPDATKRTTWTEAQGQYRKDEHTDWWACWGDLRHSGALQDGSTAMPETAEPGQEAAWDAFIDACARDVANNDCLYPSSLQPWGTQHEVAVRLSDPTGAAMSRDIPEEAAPAETDR